MVTEHYDLWFVSSVYSWPFRDTMNATDLHFSRWNILHRSPAHTLWARVPRTFGNHGEGSYTDALCSEEGSVHCLYFHLSSHTTAYTGRVACVPALKLYTRRGSEISQGKAQHLPSMQTEVAKASEAASKVGWVGRVWKDRWGRQSNRNWYGHIRYLEQLPPPRITELPQGI